MAEEHMVLADILVVCMAVDILVVDMQVVQIAVWSYLVPVDLVVVVVGVSVLLAN